MTTHVIGDVRVQVLSPTVVRLEQRGPQGFEDRPTFTVVGRDWEGASAELVGREVRTDRWVLQLPETGLDGARLLVDGAVVHEVSGLPPYGWLPAPAETGPVFALADSPRLVPPPGGAIVGNLDGEHPTTSGYDTTNDAPDLYLIVTDDPQQLRQDYLRLTGPVPLVPRWTLGLWDSRYHPYSAQQALDVIREYRHRRIPLDAFVVDTDWRVGASKGYGVNLELFPDMADFIKQAHGLGVRLMANDHPEPQALTALDPAETTYRWGGLSSLLDIGLDVWWYDRNWSTVLHEPMPGIPKETWGAAVFHDVTLANRPGQRPMIMANTDGIDNGILEKAPHPAFHRYPVSWTGDSRSTWPYLTYAVQNAVIEGVLGLVPWVHEDAGGHAGTPTPELFARFMQHCALSTGLRVHCTQNCERFPWSFGKVAQAAAEEAIRLRYRLIPTLYSAAHRAAADGTPLLRRLDLSYPEHEEARSDHQYLLGDDLLVAPVLTSNAPELPRLRGGWTAEYFAGAAPEGEPGGTVELDEVVESWSTERPLDGTAGSARYTTTVTVEPGTYWLTTGYDEMVRVRVGGQLVIDTGLITEGAVHHTAVTLEGGTHEVVVEVRVAHRWPTLDVRFGPASELAPQDWSLWVPPGDWHDPWTGDVLSGPQTVTRPYTLGQVPLLVRDGGVLFLGPDDVEQSDEQLHREITVEAWLGGGSAVRELVEDDGISLDPEVVVTQARTGADTLSIGAFARPLVVRAHVPGPVVEVLRDGVPVAFEVEPAGGPGTSLDDVFAARGGPVVVVRLDSSSGTELLFRRAE